MAKINDVYDIGAAFEAIENELMASMIRNMKRHKAEESDEKMQWSMWQTEMLKSLEKYKHDNKKKYGKRTCSLFWTMCSKQERQKKPQQSLLIWRLLIPNLVMVLKHGLRWIQKDGREA